MATFFMNSNRWLPESFYFFVSLLLDDFIGSGSPRGSSTGGHFRISSAAIPALNVERSCSEEPKKECRETTCVTSPSESSESISPVTQIDNPAYHGPKALDESSVSPSAETEELQEEKSEAQVPEKQPAVKANSQSSARKDEQPSDLCVFELNSDSGKSTPSNNGQKGDHGRGIIWSGNLS